MDPSRRLFLRGALVVAAAPAIVRAESLMRIVVPKPSVIVLDSYPSSFFGTTTGRYSSSQPELQEFPDIPDPWQKLRKDRASRPRRDWQTAKDESFGARYGTLSVLGQSLGTGKSSFIHLDFSQAELRMLAHDSFRT